MNKQEWLSECAERFKYYGCNDEEAKYMAECCLENLDDDLSYDPVDSADEEVSYWAD